MEKTQSDMRETIIAQDFLLKTIQELDISQIANANIKVFRSLNDSANEISHLAQLLKDSTSYLNEVRQLNERLDKDEKRVEMIEDLANYFKKERSNI